MSTTASVSLAAVAAGLPARYIYWHGHSGRRYLFTAADPASLADFDEGVLIAVRGDAIVWAGELGEANRSATAAERCGTAFFVHLLAATADERRGVVADLRPARGPVLRLAA